ncbi:putative Peroxiredoxin-5, mitochondrial [Hypsibius exemplaris]|uniref:Peroxiredoxin-5 n=1 Tax=Hypsibius exemplaris TaxID=2072580 RepID=A0A1W0WBX6_HYPEX|nr:putative Peroxiredoxin-5, mitochondrial [Hypsibius exemplaris]
MTLKEGDTLPDVEVYDGDVTKKVNVRELFKGKKGILFALPGAFTPGCSAKHLPSYVKKFDELKAKGVEVIACLSVNDPFVMKAWGKEHQVGDKIHMLADADSSFTKAVGLELPANPVLGNPRSKRYSAIVEDGVVKKLSVEPDGTGTTCSIADAIIEFL